MFHNVVLSSLVIYCLSRPRLISGQKSLSKLTLVMILLLFLHSIDILLSLFRDLFKVLLSRAHYACIITLYQAVFLLKCKISIAHNPMGRILQLKLFGLEHVLLLLTVSLFIVRFAHLYSQLKLTVDNDVKKRVGLVLSNYFSALRILHWS